MPSKQLIVPNEQAYLFIQKFARTGKKCKSTPECDYLHRLAAITIVPENKFMLEFLSQLTPHTATHLTELIHKAQNQFSIYSLAHSSD